MLSLVDARATGMPIIDAQDDFRRARRAHATARVWRRLRGWKRSPDYPRAPSDPSLLPAAGRRLEVVALHSIVGTVDPTMQFDARFRPASERLRGRWERIALAHRTGVALPPIVLLERPDGYYVIDGRHRVSVARTLGHPDIDAWVIGPRQASPEPTATTALAA